MCENIIVLAIAIISLDKEFRLFEFGESTLNHGDVREIFGVGEGDGFCGADAAACFIRQLSVLGKHIVGYVLDVVLQQLVAVFLTFQAIECQVGEHSLVNHRADGGIVDSHRVHQ